MSRSGYTDDGGDDQWAMTMWRGAVKKAMNGSRGQAFLREMLASMDSLPEPKLVAEELKYEDGSVCAIGTVGLTRGLDMEGIVPDDWDAVAAKFGIAPAMVREIVYENDEVGGYNHYETVTIGEGARAKTFRRPRDEKPVERFYRMRRWIKRHINGPVIIEDEIGRWADDGGPA